MKLDYELLNNIERIKKGIPTRFLDLKMQTALKTRLKKDEYFIFSPFKDSEKVIFYKDKKPKISLLEINSKDELSHQDILGSIFNLGVDSSTFGDIVIFKNRYFVYVLEELKEYFLMNLLKISHINVFLEEKNIALLNNYTREYLRKEVLVSSLRIDNVIAHLIHENREKIKDKIKKKNIILNHNILKDPTKKLISGDIFSIHRYGKYKYIKVLRTTKSGNIVLEILQYT